MSRRKILFIITQSEWGGAQQFLYTLISHLDPQKYECLVATGSDGNGQLTMNLSGIVQVVTIENLKRNPTIISDIKSLFEIRRLIKAWQPHTLFLNSSKAGLNGSLAARLGLGDKTPRVLYRIGGWAFNDPRPWYQRLFILGIERFSASFKDNIIVNNQHDYNQARRWRILPRQKLHLIYNGLDTRAHTLIPGEEARRHIDQLHVHDTSVPWIGTIANFYPTKGLEYLIQAMTQVSQPFRAYIIGDGQERSRIERLINHHKLGDKIHLVGTLTDARRYLSAFDIYVQPSLKEGFSWALLEAMASHLPVIATQTGAAPELIEHDVSGLLIPTANSRLLAQNIEALLSNQSQRQKLAEQAFERVTSHFSLERMIREYEKLL